VTKPPDKHGKLSIGIIGCGHWGPNHIRVFSQIKEAEVTAVADPSESRLSTMLELFPALDCYPDYVRLLKDAGVDAVVVATPTSTHAKIVTEALKAGKHVLCEKPLCDDAAAGEKLVQLARSEGLTLMVGHIFLFNPGIRKVKELIDKGEIGAVRSLSAVRTNLGPVRSDVNAAWDLASHDISIFNWLLDAEPIEVQAMGAAFLQPGIEDVVNITMRYPGNVLASIQCSWLDPKKVRQITIVGSERMMTWDDLALSNPVAIYEKAVHWDSDVSGYGEFLRLSMLDGDVRLPKVPALEPLKAQNSAFVTAILEAKQPPADGAFGLGVVRALAAVQEALACGSSVK
jgi:predicted dehydrogenase